MSIEIVKAIWFNEIGIVKVNENGNPKFYIGTESEFGKRDAMNVAEYGVEFPFEAGVTLFKRSPVDFNTLI